MDHSTPNRNVGPAAEPPELAEQQLAVLLESYDEALWNATDDFSSVAVGGQLSLSQSASITQAPSPARASTHLPDDAADGNNGRVVKTRRCLERLDRLRRHLLDDLSVDDSLSVRQRFGLVAPPEFVNVAEDAPLCIGRFHLIRELGRGGQGIVYLARDMHLHREVALKVPRPELLMSRDARARFLREGRIAAGLDHPNLLTLLEAGEAGPICYLAQAFCDGPSLAAWLAERTSPIPPRLAAELTAQLANGIEHAHQRGVLHRDLKPSNVLLQPRRHQAMDEAVAGVDVTKGEDSSLEFPFLPKISDFGLAKLAEGSHHETATGAVLGTPAYMAPEQASGQSTEVGQAADIYGLGAILYELLVGRPPFRGVSDADTLRQVLFDEPVRPRSIRAGVSSDLEAICLCALEKHPRERYSSASAMADDLQRFLAGHATRVRPISAAARAIKFCKRRPAIAALVAVCIAAVTTIVTGTLIYDQQLRSALAQAREQGQLRQSMLYATEINLAQIAHEDEEHVQLRDNSLRRQLPREGESDLREFAWHQLSNQSPACLQTLRGHHGDVYGAEFSPNGDMLATAGKDATIRLWDVRSGRELATLLGHQDEVGELAFLDSGRLLASLGDEGKIYVWDVASRGLLHKLEVAPQKINVMSAVTGGARLACGTSDFKVQMWDAARGELLWTRDAEDRAAAIALSPDGSEVATLYGWLHLQTWDGNTGDMLGLYLEPGNSNQVNLAYSAAGNSLVAANRQLDLRVLQRTAVENEWVKCSGRPLIKRENSIHGLSISPLDNAIAFGTQQGNVQIRQPGGRVERTFTAHSQRVWKTCWSPDGNLLASASRDGTAKIWNCHVRTSRKFTYPRPSGAIDYFSLSPDGQRIATLSRTGRVQMWDRQSRSLTATYHPLQSGGFVWHTSNDEILGIDCSGIARCWIASTGEELRHSNELQFSDRTDGSGITRIFATHMDRREVELFDMRRFAAKTLFAVNGFAHGVAMAPDQSRLAVATEKKQIEIWRVSPPTKERVIQLGQHTWSGHFIFTPDGRQLINCGDDEPITVWNLNDGSVAKYLNGNRGLVNVVTCSHNGRTLAVAGANGRSSGVVIQLWDLASGAPLSSLETGYGVHKVEFTPNDDALIACGTDGGIGWLEEWSCEARLALRPATVSTVRRPLDEFALQPHPALIAVVRADDPAHRMEQNQLVMRKGFDYSIAKDRFDEFLIDGQIEIPADFREAALAFDHPPIGSLTVRLGFKGHPELYTFLSDIVKSIEIYADSNSSGEYELDVDLLVGKAPSMNHKGEFITIPFNETVSRSASLNSEGIDVRLKCARLFRAVHDYAIDAGYAGGYPTFNVGSESGTPTVQIVLIRCPQSSTKLVSAERFEETYATSVTDFNSQKALLKAMLIGARGWCWRRQFGAGLPTMYAVESSDHPLRYEVTVFPNSNFVPHEVPLQDIGKLENLTLTFQRAHQLATEAGFRSGFPTFLRDDQTAGCIFIKPEAAEMREISLDVLYCPSLQPRP